VRRPVTFIAQQAVLIVLAVLAYFGVRGLTESDAAAAHLNARRVLDLEQLLHIDIELGLQALVRRSELAIDLANWIYIWGHWPVVVATLVVLAVVDRDSFFELRNAMFISGAIGLVIFATFAVTPPRLFGTEYLDTVTVRSSSYRVLQPPNLVNKFAAVPSLHFGWNLLVGWIWVKSTRSRAVAVAGVLMPMAMAFAVVATANHWVLDVVIGGMVALTGLAIERRRAARSAARRAASTPGCGEGGGLTPDLGEALDGGHRGQDQHQPQDRQEKIGDGQADGQGDDALRPFHDAPLGVEPQGLGLGPLVGDQPRDGQDRDGDHGHQAAVVGDEVPDDTTDQDRVRHPVRGGVEEGASDRGRSCGLGHRTVEQVGDGGDDQHDAAEPQPPAGHQRSRPDRGQHPGHGQGIGRQAGPMEAGPDRIDRSLDGRAPLTVKHPYCSR
jgi:hypothetical protein